MSNPPRTGLATPHPRQRHPTTNHGPAATRSANISLTARRAQHRRTATDPADHTHRRQARTRQPCTPHLTNGPPYQLSAFSKVASMRVAFPRDRRFLIAAVLVFSVLVWIWRRP